MSGTSNAPEGIVRNSALEFVASAQLSLAGAERHGQSVGGLENGSQTDKLVPPGLKTLYDACTRLYPDQPNPLQVTTRIKYWLGARDPLDYISMYWNPGKPEENVPPHWHYVSFGLSDLHGDGRVHPPPDRVSMNPDRVSGFGLELTFRLLAAPGTAPPLWPPALMQALARYVFATGNKFCAGDHISWHAPLDGSPKSRIRHLLVADDRSFETLRTPHGSVTLLQLVGCTGRELKAAQRGSGFEVLTHLSKDTKCGGPWLVTDSSRRRSVKLPRIDTTKPVPLAGVSAKVNWFPLKKSEYQISASEECLELRDKQEDVTLRSVDSSRAQGHMSTDSFEMSSIEKALPQIPELMQNSWCSEDNIEYFDGVHLILNAEAASLLPLAIDGRVSHGRHFTWRGTRAASVVSPAVRKCLVSRQTPIAAARDWLQILIPKELEIEMSRDVAKLSKLADNDSESESEGEEEGEKEDITLPFTLEWPKYNLKISVVHNSEIL